MAYTPYEWTVNSYLNPTRMNAIEQGIAAASQAAESASGEFHTIEELIGTQSIAGIGDGTLTGATWKINNDLSDLKNTVTTLNSNLNSMFVTDNIDISGTDLAVKSTKTYTISNTSKSGYRIISITPQLQTPNANLSCYPVIFGGNDDQIICTIVNNSSAGIATWNFRIKITYQKQ